MKIIDGRKIAQKIKTELKKKISSSPTRPGLGVILVGDDPASHLYVALKEKACQEVGIVFKKFVFSKKTSASTIIKKINALNHNPNIHGILIQLPLPRPVPANKIIQALEPKKDADGFHPQNIHKLLNGEKTIEPVLIKTVWQLLTKALPPKKLHNKKSIIIGKSDIFTLPLKKFLENRGLQVERQMPKNLRHHNLKKYDIVITAAGKPRLLNGAQFKSGATVIDIGINKLKNGKIVGDVDFTTTLSTNGWITPVPGGVGPVTVAMLLKNVYLLSKRHGN